VLGGLAQAGANECVVLERRVGAGDHRCIHGPDCRRKRIGVRREWRAQAVNN
jgi:hypothetical protein